MKDGRDSNEPKETPTQSFAEFREQFRKKDPAYENKEYNEQDRVIGGPNCI